MKNKEPGITENPVLFESHLKMILVKWTNTKGIVRFWKSVRRIMKNKKTNERSFDHIAVVVPVTNEGKIVFISQFRATVGAVLAGEEEKINESGYQVIEFPAGVVDEEGKNVLSIAAKELQEEAGFSAKSWTILNEGTVSAGMSFEYATEFLARLLERVPRGETEEEKGITVYEIPLSGALKWLEEKRKEGFVLDSRVKPLTFMVQVLLSK